MGEEETDAGQGKRRRSAKVCGSDRRTVTHLMKEYGGYEKGEKKKKLLGTENDELNWMEGVI